MNSRIPIATLTVAALSLFIQAIPGGAEALQFTRVGVSGGEAWRWLTAHLTHFDWNHLTWDVGVLLVLGWICERQSRARFLFALGLASVSVTTAVWLFQPRFAMYRGLSGLDSALFGLFATSLGLRSDCASRRLGWLALGGFGAKCAFEVATHATLFAAGDNYQPVPLAHLAGLMAGVLAGLSARWALSPSAACSTVPPPCPSDHSSPTPTR